MKKIINSIKDLLLWLWQSPQNILAIIFEGLLCKHTIRDGKAGDNYIIYCDVLPSAMSLGDYIFIPPYTSDRTIRHEAGHSKQSAMLGPLYLIVIGIPSLLHNIIRKLFKKIGITWNYYSFYTEAWADRLAGIKR